MAVFLGPSNPFVNKDTVQSMFNEVVAFNYDFNVNHDGATHLDFRRTSNDQQVSVMFALNAARSITSVEIWMRASNLLSGNITATIFPEGSGVGIPATVGSLGASSAVDAASLTIGSYSRVKFTFGSPIALNAGQSYYVVLTSTVAQSGVDYMQIASDATPVGYMRSGKYNGTTWSAQTYHSCFIVYYKATTKIAQSFIASGDQKLDSVVLSLDRVSSPTGNLILEIRDDLVGSPALTGPANNVSNPVAISSMGVSTFDNLITFTFPVQPDLLDGKIYHFVLSATVAQTASARIDVDSENVTPSYGGGKVSVDNLDGTWRTIEQDLVFEIYYFEQVAPNTLGDELALLGDPPLDCRAQQVWLKNLVTTLSSFYPSILPPLYGGTGVGDYEPGDILYATDDHHLERLPIGTFGQSLGVSLGGLPIWGGSGGNVLLSLQNNSAGPLVLGDVVVFDLTGSNMIKTTTKIRDTLFAGVVQDTIDVGEFGPVLISGRTQVRINGTVVAGDFLDTTTIAKRVAAARFGPIKALQGGSSGSLVFAFVSNTLVIPAYAKFADVQAFNVNGATLTDAVWTNVGVNTEIADTHGLMSVSANQITVGTGAGGIYAVKASCPIGNTSTMSVAFLKLRRISGVGGAADLIIGNSPGPQASSTESVHAVLDGEVTVSDGDVLEFQAYATGAGTERAGTAHGISGFNNTYLIAEFQKVA